MFQLLASAFCSRFLLQLFAPASGFSFLLLLFVSTFHSCFCSCLLFLPLPYCASIPDLSKFIYPAGNLFDSSFPVPASFCFCCFCLFSFFAYFFQPVVSLLGSFPAYFFQSAVCCFVSFPFNFFHPVVCSDLFLSAYSCLILSGSPFSLFLAVPACCLFRSLGAPTGKIFPQACSSNISTIFPIFIAMSGSGTAFSSSQTHFFCIFGSGAAFSSSQTRNGIFLCVM